MRAPFVGRDLELGKLTGLVQRAVRDRTTAAALVAGEPGSGKSRLLEELLRKPGGARIVRLAGFEPMQQVPLGAAADLLRLLARAPGDGPTLDRLAFGSGHERAAEPLRIFEAAHRALAASGPLCIAVDDLQWADDRSVALLHYLLRSSGRGRQALVVLGFGRPSPVTAALRAGLEADVPAERLAVVELQPLALVDGVRLLRSLDPSLDDGGAADLWRRAAGSPFWLEALAQSRLADEPAELVRQRLRDLSVDAGRIMSVLSVVGRPLAIDELAEIERWTPDRIRDGSRELIARGMAVDMGGVIRPGHDLIREAIAAGLPGAARRAIHARIAEWIEANAGDDLPLLREALQHRLAAGEPTPAVAMRVLASPGHRLLDDLDLRLLASISDRMEPGSPARLTIDRELGRLGAMTGELDLALERWARVADEAGDPSEQRLAETEAARAAYRSGRSEAAHEHLDRARSAATQGGGTTILLDAIQADVELWLDHQTARGRETAERAVAAGAVLAATHGGVDGLPLADRRAYLAAILAAIDGAMQEDQDNEIVRLAEPCMRIARSLDDESRVTAMLRVGQALRTVANARAGEALAREAWDASRGLVLPTLTVEAGHRLARVLRDLGRLSEGHAVAAEAGELDQRLKTSPRQWGAGPSIGHLLELSISDPRAALEALARDASEELDPHYRQDLHLAIATWLARTSGSRAAGEVDARLAAAHVDAELARCPRHSNVLALATAELLARTGRPAEARRALIEWDRRPGTGEVSRDLWRLRTAATVLFAEGKPEEASEMLGSYADAVDAADLRLEVLWARIDLGRGLADHDRRRAIGALTAAAELADACGAASEGRLTRQALRRLGVRAWRRAAGTERGVDRLSAREREVARLVAEGRSNREVADQLLVAPKTIERHVSNIFAKLGIRNRTELASHVHSTPGTGFPR